MASFDGSALPSKRAKEDSNDDQPSLVSSSSFSSSSSSLLPPPAALEEFLPAAKDGDDATVASALRNPLIDPNMTNQYGRTALMMAASCKHDSVVKMLLADKRVDPNIVRQRDGSTALSITANYNYRDILVVRWSSRRSSRMSG